jgi:hypothetical protein
LSDFSTQELLQILQSFLTILGTQGLPLAGILGGLWALQTWRSQQRYNSARWQSELVNKFYLSDDFHQIRLKFEFDFYSVYGPPCERWDTNKDLLTQSDKELIAEVDAVVNFFENLLYLITQNHISERDHFAAFSYWYVLMQDEEHAALRQYMRYGFENIQNRTKMVCPTIYADTPDRIERAIEKLGLPQTQPRFRASLKNATICPHSGRITKSNSTLELSAVEVSEKLFFDDLDKEKCFDPSSWAQSEQIRRYILIDSEDWHIVNRDRNTHPQKIGRCSVGSWVYISADEALTFANRKSGKWELDRPK